MSVAEHLFAQFVSRTGDQLGPAIKLPADTTVEQLHAILHGLLEEVKFIWYFS